MRLCRDPLRTGPEDLAAEAAHPRFRAR